MKVCREQLPDAIALAEKQLDLSFPRGATWIASRFNDGRLAGVAVFTGIAKSNCFLHIAACSPRWFTPEFCREMFRIPFEDFGCLRLTASIQAGNVSCLRLAERTGFVQEGYLRGFEFGDLHMFGMLKENCKWVES